MSKTIGFLALSHCLFLMACTGKTLVDAENGDADPTTTSDGASDAPVGDGATGQGASAGRDGASAVDGSGGIDGSAGASASGGAAGTGGRGGAAGTGNSGAAGTGGNVGAVGTGGTGGVAGTAGNGGAAGTGGHGGIAGTGADGGAVDGSAGKAGNGGSGGASGQGGTSGAGGIAGGADADASGGGAGTGGQDGSAGTGVDSGAGGANADAGRPDAGDGSAPPDGPMACEKALYGDILDPGEVYLAGSIIESACYTRALAHWSCPNVAATGFDCYFDGNSSTGGRLTAFVRPTDGRLIYTNPGTELFVREFHCDNCPYDPNLGYPNSPLVNDPTLPKDCELAQGEPRFLVAPTGVVLYYCFATQTWRDSGGHYIYAGEPTDPLLHVGYGNMGLTATRIVDLATGNAVPVVGFGDPLSARAIRAVPPDKFWIANMIDYATQNVELWEIDAAGMAQRVSQYAAMPAEATYIDGWGRLDKDGAFFQIARVENTNHDIIVRRDRQGSSKIVYTDATGPLVKIHISGLITGP